MHFFGHYILSVVLFTPLVGALLLLFIPREMENAHKIAGNVFGALGFLVSLPLLRWWNPGRSEEHTSELQSHLNLVCRLLLENNNNHNNNYTIVIACKPAFNTLHHD